MIELKRLIIEAVRAPRELSARDVNTIITKMAKFPKTDAPNSRSRQALDAARMFWRVATAMMGHDVRLSSQALDDLRMRMPAIASAISLIDAEERL